MNAIGIKSRFGGTQSNKFSKEYKSPQESRFKMASFTEIVKTKTKTVSKNPLTQIRKPEDPNSKLKPRYSYLSSTVKKPRIKAVKHEKIYLDQKESKITPQQSPIPKTTLSTRKCLSNQRQRISSKFTTGVPKRDTGLNGFRSSGKISERVGKRSLINQHTKKVPVRLSLIHI